MVCHTDGPLAYSVRTVVSRPPRASKNHLFNSLLRVTNTRAPRITCITRDVLFVLSVLQASLDDVDDIEGLLELDEEKDVMIITDENEMGQVRPLTRQRCILFWLNRNSQAGGRLRAKPQLTLDRISVARRPLPYPLNSESIPRLNGSS